MLDIRTQTNVPLWLGESGENSNPWFFAVTRLMEQHGIGWNWWTHKKIETTTSPLSAPFAPGYEAVLDYWRGSGPRPSAEAARAALFALAEGLDMDSTVVRPGVLAALFEPDYATLRAPFKAHRIPGAINAVDYDLGNQGITYSDSDVMATTGAPGGGNNGGKYPNDGVDIEPSTDPEGFAFNVGWTQPTEWLTYTVTVETAGQYDVEIRVASDVGGGLFRLELDGAPMGDDLAVENTGGWQNWTSVWLRDVSLPAGEHILRLLVRVGDFNVNRMRFTLATHTAAEALPAAPAPARLLGAYPNPFTDGVRVAFFAATPVRAHLEVFDMLGRTVFVRPRQPFAAGEHTLALHPDLAAGLYLFRLFLDDGHRTHSFTEPLIVIR